MQPRRSGGRMRRRSHVTNGDTGQSVHKAAALAHVQKVARDAKPGAGHTQRYVTADGRAAANHSGGQGWHWLCVRRVL